MRQLYHIRLDALGDHGSRMCGLASDTLRQATTALLNADLSLAEEVIARDAQMDRMRADAEDAALELLALQAPMASDLRVVVSALWVVSDLQRMGALAIHVAKVARRRHPANAVPAAVRPIVEQMGMIGVELADQAESVLRRRDVDLARTLEKQDDAMDELQQRIFVSLHSPSWTAGVGPAVDLAMLSRFYERFADHAVAVARRVVYLVTGENVGGATTPSFTSSDDD